MRGTDAPIDEDNHTATDATRWPRMAAGMVLLAALALLGLFGYRMAAGTGGGKVTGTPGVFSTGRLASVPFRQAPDFELRLYSGETLRLSDLSGKPVVLNFWASWCPPCREEAPLLERTWREHRDRRVAFVGVNVWDREEDARAFLEEYGVTYANGASPPGQPPVAVEYALTGIPETYFIGRNGEVRRKWIGSFTGGELRAFLDEVAGPEGR